MTVRGQGHVSALQLYNVRPGGASLTHTAAMKALLLAGLVLLAGCGTSDKEPASESAGPCGLDFLNQAAEVVSEPEVAEASEEDSNLALDVNSVSSEPVRVTVRFDGKVALDIRTPATPEDCSHSPVYSHEFRLPGRAVTVTATTDHGQHSSISVPLDGAKHWVVVGHQDGFPLELRAYDEEVVWG